MIKTTSISPSSYNDLILVINENNHVINFPSYSPTEQKLKDEKEIIGVWKVKHDYLRSVTWKSHLKAEDALKNLQSKL